MNVILCTGMMRSGSTWSFNVCRLIAIQMANRIRVPVGGGYFDNQELDELLRTKVRTDPGIAVIKSHSPAELAAQLILSGQVKSVCTIRDPRDCVASRRLFENETFEQSLNFIKSNLAYISLYKQSPHTLFIRYEDMMEDRQTQIKAIANYLGMTLDNNLVSEIDRQTDMESSRKISDGLKQRPPETLRRDRSHFVDPITHLHENHIHGGLCGRWKTELTPEQREIVMHEFSASLVSLGYETETSLKKTSSWQ